VKFFSFDRPPCCATILVSSGANSWRQFPRWQEESLAKRDAKDVAVLIVPHTPLAQFIRTDEVGVCLSLLHLQMVRFTFSILYYA
jgi:hypothetical protein